MEKFLMWLTESMPARAIDLDGNYYIERYSVLKVGKLHVMLHRYLGCDGDREVHDHPWRWCLGIPLINGYTEERVIGFCPDSGWISKMVDISFWRWNFINPMRFHKISHVEKGTWTLFITYDRFKSWSFASQPITMAGSIVLRQPYNTKAVAGWVERAPKGKEFRISRVTDK